MKQCPKGLKCIPGHGPIPCRYFGLGEAPGIVESNTGVPLTGPTGQEFNETYLPLAGLHRDRYHSDIYVTNTVKHCMTINRKPTEDDIKQCTNCMLRTELNKVRPEIVFLMGATACSLIPDIDLESDHGIPQVAELFDREYIVIPMYHPALGLHKTDAMTTLLDDWSNLKEYLKYGVWKWPVDSGEKYYGLIEHIADLDEYFMYTDHSDLELVGVDTETHGKDEFSIQFSIKPHTGMMVLTKDSELVKETVYALNSFKETMVLHNAPADLPMLRELGITLPYRDTQQEAYQLCRYPQALKALSKRLLGRKRLSWEETVSGPSKDKLYTWLANAVVYVQDNWTEEIERYSEKTGKKLKSKFVKHPAESMFNRVMRHTYSPTYNPWDKLMEGMTNLQVELGRKKFDPDDLFCVLGDPPVKGIGNCELEDAVYYGCSDADDTLRVALEFDRIRQQGIVEVYEDDWD